MTLAMHYDGRSWRLVPTPNPAGRGDTELSSVVAIAPHDAWAVGWDGPFGDGAPLVEHWDGARWRIVGVPSYPGHWYRLGSVAATGPADVWAVETGFRYADTNGPIREIVLHWNGSAWHWSKRHRGRRIQGWTQWSR